MSIRESKSSPLNSIAKLLSGLGLVLFLAISSLMAIGDSRPRDTIVINTKVDKTTITDGAEYILLDHSVSAEDIASASYDQRWRPYDGTGINDGGKNQELWLRFTARQSDMSRNIWYLVVAWPILDHIQLSILNHENQRWWQSPAMGNEYPLENKIVSSRFFVFPVRFTEQEPQTLYLNIRSAGLLSLPVSFWRSEALSAYSYVDSIILGAFIGAMVIMLLYNLSLAILLKDNVYWYYCIYVLSIIVYQTVISGLASFYIWSSSPWMLKYGLLLSSTAAFFTATLFIRNFLKLREHGGWLLWGNNFLLVGWVIITISGFVASPALIAQVINIFSFIASFIAIVTGVALWKRNVPTAKIFLISWSLLILGTTIYILGLQGVLPFNIVTRYSQMVGFVSELILLSIALAYRINLEITERETAQSDALMLTKKVSEERRERLKAQMETLEVQRQLNEELERHVIERTEQLNDAMVKLESANAELTKLSVTDPLTKVHNRRYFDDTLINEYKRALRTHQYLGIIVVDIDHFKSINDNYGHIVGDQCISLVANTLKKVINRPGDLVARYGGEEFVYILPGSDERNALIVADNCRAAVEELEFQVEGKPIPLRVSAGIAAWIPSEEGAYKQLINAADTALYRAKSAGRNCVKTASDRGKLAQI
jgi:diguanylate cyclase